MDRPEGGFQNQCILHLSVNFCSCTGRKESISNLPHTITKISDRKLWEKKKIVTEQRAEKSFEILSPSAGSSDHSDAPTW